MIKSIRYFLLVSLLVSITLASAINGVGNYLLDEQVVQPFLDSQLVRMSSLIDVLYQSSTINHEPTMEINKLLASNQDTSSEKFIFQVWDHTGKQILRSPNKVEISLHHVPLGFSDQEIQGNDWRIYSYFNAQYKVKIVVAELY